LLLQEPELEEDELEEDEQDDELDEDELLQELDELEDELEVAEPSYLAAVKDAPVKTPANVEVDELGLPKVPVKSMKA